MKNDIIWYVEEKSFTETKQSKKGFSGSIGGGSVSASYGKSKDEIKVTNTTNVATNITSGGKVTITAEGGKATLNSADVYSDKGIDISGTKGVDLTVSKDVTTVDEKHKSTSIGFDVEIKGEIKNTAENIKNPEKLVDFKGDKYNIANTASDLVGAIRDGADAVNDVTSDKYKKGSENSKSSNLEGLSRDPNSYLSASAGINKNKSESHSYQESTLKGNLASKGDINITSSEGSVKIEGTDITTEKDLNIKADKNIEVVSSKDKYNSSHSSSSSGVTADLNIAKNPSQIFAGVTVSENKGNGNTNGYTNVNSNFNVGGTHRAEASESVKYQGANVTANKVEIKGEKVEISSAKDSEKSKEESKSGNIKFNPSGSINKIDLGYEKGNGEKDWVSNQTSIVAQNGGTIESKDFINKGALIGSSNENEKLVVKADNVKVENLKDKDTFKNHGGGIKIDTSLTVPGATVVYDEKDKRQNTNSTAINTDFIVKGENKKAEDLGFNTDINKAQEITKDEEHHLDANLHTDLLNQEERDKITEAGEKLKNAAEAIVNPNEGGIFNTYKENRYGNLFNKYANEQKEYLEILGDKNVDAKEKRNVLNQMVQEFLTERGYEGPMPIIMIGNATQSVDSRYDGVERIYISKDDLTNKNILSILGHELGHFNTYDNDEKTAKNIEKRVDVEIKETTTNGKYKDLLGKLDEKYKDIPDQEEAIKEQESIPDEYKENVVQVAAGVMLYLATVIYSPDIELDMMSLSDSLAEFSANPGLGTGALVVVDATGIAIPGVGSTALKGVTKVIVKGAKTFIVKADGTIMKVVSKNSEKLVEIATKIKNSKYAKRGEAAYNSLKECENSAIKNAVNKNTHKISNAFEYAGDEALETTASIGAKNGNDYGIIIEIPEKIKKETSEIISDIQKNGDSNGEKTEKLVDMIVKQDENLEVVSGKYGSNNGFDHVIINKKTNEVMILDSKQYAKKNTEEIGKATLNKNKGSKIGTQLSEEWIENVSKKMPKETQKIIQEAERAEKIKTGVIGVNKTTGSVILIPVKVIDNKVK